jgi:hypothetical protein
MTHTDIRSLLLIGTIIGMAAPAYAQQTQDAAKAPVAAPAPSAPATTTAPAAAPAPSATAAPATTAATAAPVVVVHTSTVAATPDVPSADILKKARNAGLHTKVKQGVVYYCKTETDMGSRFTSERCYDENQLAQFLIQQQAARDQFSKQACAGAACSGK